MDLTKSMIISAAGMKAQAARMRVVSENLANADTTADVPGGDPFRRKTITFRNLLDRAEGINKVTVQRYGVDRSNFESRYDPRHPAADADGYVLLPNVKPMLELMDMREAQRSYEANLAVIESSKSMLTRTIDLLRE